MLDGDLANSTRADIFAAAVPDRFFEMGIAEQNMVGVAAGMATLGFVPWLSTFAAFMANRATDQVRIVVAQPHLNVKMCGGYTGILTGKTGKTHQSVEDIAIFRAMPGVVTLAPADAVELRSAMRAMMETPGPMYLRVTRDPSPVIFPDDYPFQIGPGVLLRDGGDVGLIGTGVQTVRVLEAARSARRRGDRGERAPPADPQADRRRRHRGPGGADRPHRDRRGPLDHRRARQRRGRSARRAPAHADAPHRSHATSTASPRQTTTCSRPTESLPAHVAAAAREMIEDA